MNFNRVSLKTKAKRILRKNWGWAVLATLILSITVPSFSGVLSPFVEDNTVEESRVVSQDDEVTSSNNDMYYMANEYLRKYDPQEIVKRTKKNIENTFRDVFPFYKGPIWGLISLVVGLSLFFAFLVRVFVLNPLYVGCLKWYIENRTTEKPKLKLVLSGFKNNYSRTVWVMFTKDVFTFLWFLLFIIPGVIKSYEYKMIPYILAENPNVSREEAFAMTKKIMDGNKMDTFVLDLSFIPWMMLCGLVASIIGFNLLYILYVFPYIMLTNTELYVCLCQGKEKYEAIN